ncbi:MAG: substrate-binding domain-containing protein [Cellvibrionaceae bacterium]|nr:substrate-binding domain-containing protein [Cellvibrionaceae bacterium]
MPKPVSGIHSIFCLFIACATAANTANTSIYPQIKNQHTLPEKRLFTLSGSDTVGAKLAPAQVKAWMKQQGMSDISVLKLGEHHQYRIAARKGEKKLYVDVHALGSSTGINGLLSKQADIAMSSRPIKALEAAQLQQSHGTMRSVYSEHVIAIDGVVVILHPQNPITTLNIDTIAKIFAGQISNWQSLGGLNQRINIYARDSHSGTFDTFKKLVLKTHAALSESAERVVSNQALSQRVSEDPAAIGFVGMAYVGNAKTVAVKDKNTHPFSPAPLFIATEDYPLSRRLFMYTAETNSNPLAKSFIDFALSKQGQKLVEENGFVSMNPIKRKVVGVSGPADYEALIQGGERLSVNFRFQPREAKLDSKARKDIKRVADYFKGLDNKNYQVKLVGFSNERVSSARANVLSLLRASAVKIALFREGVDTDQVLGFGSDLLVANSEGTQGNKNDRVEVWIVQGTHNHIEQTAGSGSFASKNVIKSGACGLCIPVTTQF